MTLSPQGGRRRVPGAFGSTLSQCSRITNIRDSIWATGAIIFNVSPFANSGAAGMRPTSRVLPCASSCSGEFRLWPRAVRAVRCAVDSFSSGANCIPARCVVSTRRTERGKLCVLYEWPVTIDFDVQPFHIMKFSLNTAPPLRHRATPQKRRATPRRKAPPSRR